MDALRDQVDDLVLAESAPQLNLAAIFVSSLEATESDASSAAALQSLWEVLTEGCTDDERDARMASTFGDSSLELLPVLAPLLNRPPEVAQLAARILLEGLGGYSSPREVILAVGEQIEDLLEVERALANDGQGSDSDALSDGVGEHAERETPGADTLKETRSMDESDDDSQPDSNDGEPSPLDAQLPTLIRLLTLRLAQMKGRKALPTVMHLSSLLQPAISRFASHRPSVGLCRDLVLAVTRLIIAVHTWAQTGKDDWSPKGEQTPLLFAILSETVVRLRPGLNIKSLERASILQDAPPAVSRSVGGQALPGLGDWPEGMGEIMMAADQLLPESTDQPSKALPLITSEKHSDFALILLSFAPPPLPPSEAQATLVTLIARVLSRENAAAAGPFLWSLLKSITPACASDEMYEAIVTQIWTVYVPLLAADPDPQTRKALFSLLSSSIAPALLLPLKTLDLLLPFPSPFLDSPLLRPAGLHFLRGLVINSGSLGWLKGAGLNRLGVEAFSLPFVQDESLESWDVEEEPSGETWIRGPGPVAVVLALNIFALLLARDVQNESGIRLPEVLNGHIKRWIDPLRQALDARPRSASPVAASSIQHTFSHSHLQTGCQAHSHSRMTGAETDHVESGDDEDNVRVEEDGDHAVEGESDAAWETVSFALEGVEKAISSLS